MVEQKHHKITPKALVSIITVNYDQPEITCELIASLKEITYPRIEIIVVDNGSPHKNPGIINKKFPDVILVVSSENLGFAGGNNLGIRVAKGDYLLFLNNDTEVEPGFLEPLVNLFQTHPDAGMVSPKLIFYHSENRKTIQYAGGNTINPYTGRGGSRGYKHLDNNQFDDISITHHCHGAAMMIPHRVLEVCGLMPEVYFLYYEELDWAQMIKKNGYNLYYCGQSKVFHKESVSTGKDTPLKMYYMTRGRLIFTRRNQKGFKKLISLLFFFFIAVPKNSLQLLIRRDFQLLSAFTKGWFWHFSHHDIFNTPVLKKDKQGNNSIEGQQKPNKINI